VKITVTVNLVDYTRDVEPRLLLIHFLRDDLGLTGSHWGCDTSNCGACVVWLDETPVKSCTVLAVMADGRRVATVEGLAAGGALDPVQEAFAVCHGLQCGFCTPGMLMTARWLLDQNPDPTPGEIREAISGQICRCTGYENIVRSVLWAAKHDGAAAAGPVGDGPAGDAATRPWWPSSPARTWPSAGWPGCRRSSATCRRCSPPTRSASRARRSRSWSRPTGTRRGTPSS
jgi:carbon-monoxide dehydrogenase small subunit